MLQKLVLLVMAGGLGTAARYGLTVWVGRFEGLSFPWGTLLVNLIGCFSAGLLLALFDKSTLLNGTARLMILIGFMGAFTTFSTFILDTGQLMQAGQYMRAFGNLALQNVGGLAAFAVGFLALRAMA